MSNTAQNPFQTGGAEYAQSRPTYPTSLINELKSRCNAHDHAVDIGCGTGQLSLLLADAFTRVTAIDPSISQLDHASKHPGITYQCAHAEETNLDAGIADLVTVAQAAHWLKLEQFYREAKRIAKPGCLLALISYGLPQIDDTAIQTAFEGFYWGKLHQYWSKERAHVENGYRDLFFPFEALSFPAHYIERQWSLSVFANYVNTWSAIKNARNASADAIIETGLNDIAAAWQEPDKARRITWKISTKIAHL